MRFQLALNVDDIEVAIDYYRRLFAVEVNKREPGYANFVVDALGLKLVLFEAPGAERLNHVGFEVDDETVTRMAGELEERGVLTEHQRSEVCCYARQNKAVSHDPQGLMWEFYRVLEDSPTFFAPETPAAEDAVAEVATASGVAAAGAEQETCCAVGEQGSPKACC